MHRDLSEWSDASTQKPTEGASQAEVKALANCEIGNNLACSMYSKKTSEAKTDSKKRQQTDHVRPGSHSKGFKF